MLNETTFNFTALDASGARVLGHVEALNKKQARAVLPVKDLNPLLIEPVTQPEAA